MFHAIAYKNNWIQISNFDGKETFQIVMRNGRTLKYYPAKSLHSAKCLITCHLNRKERK